MCRRTWIVYTIAVHSNDVEGSKFEARTCQHLSTLSRFPVFATTMKLFFASFLASVAAFSPQAVTPGASTALYNNNPAWQPWNDVNEVSPDLSWAAPEPQLKRATDPDTSVRSHQQRWAGLGSNPPVREIPAASTARPVVAVSHQQAFVDPRPLRKSNAQAAVRPSSAAMSSTPYSHQASWAHPVVQGTVLKRGMPVSVASDVPVAPPQTLAAPVAPQATPEATAPVEAATPVQEMASV